MKTIFKVFDEKFNIELSKPLFEITEPYLTKRMLNKVIYKINGTRYSYSSFKLFCKSENIETVDKILYYIDTV